MRRQRTTTKRTKTQATVLPPWDVETNIINFWLTFYYYKTTAYSEPLKLTVPWLFQMIPSNITECNNCSHCIWLLFLVRTNCTVHILCNYLHFGLFCMTALNFLYFAESDLFDVGWSHLQREILLILFLWFKCFYFSFLIVLAYLEYCWTDVGRICIFNCHQVLEEKL